MLKPTKEQIEKLPRWAQEHIANIERERFVAVRSLNEAMDAQTVSPFYIDDWVCTGEQTGPVTKRRYIQGHKIQCLFDGILMEILLSEGAGRDRGIHISWNDEKRLTGKVALVPTSYQKIVLINKANL